MIENPNNYPLPIMLWLLNDSYDHDDRTNAISTTTLLKPIKEIVLSSRITEPTTIDISKRVKSKLGTAIHDSLEAVFKDKDNLEKLLKLVGYSSSKHLDIHTENRSEKEIDGFIVTGKYDLVINGLLSDYKSTTVYGMGRSKKDHILQGSIYRWLNPELIKEDYMEIIYILTDWSNKSYDKDYPKDIINPVYYELMSLEDTEMYIRTKLNDIKKYWDSEYNELPLCNKEEMWQGDPTYKYYKNPNNLTRSTKNFSNYYEAYARLQKDGNIGTIITHKAKAYKCQFCSGLPLCTQGKANVENT